MRISVVVPCYNAEPYLGQTLGSLLEQTRRPDEIVVVDDGSTDGSRAVAEGFRSEVEVVTQRHGSAAETRNHGASLVSGEAIMFLDADDVLGPGAIEALGEAVERNPGCVAACPWYRLERVEGVWVKRPPSCRPRLPGQDPLEGWLRGWYHPPCSVLWSRTAYDRTGGWDRRAAASNDDGDLMMRALILGIPLHFTSKGSAYYRRLPEPASSLSGKRRTAEGLRSRIGVVERIARMLDERGRLDTYRAALDEALDFIIQDCAGDHPELTAECAELHRRFGQSWWKRKGSQGVGRLRSLLDRIWRAVPPPPWRDPPPAGPPEEIRYGLEAAEQRTSPEPSAPSPGER